MAMKRVCNGKIDSNGRCTECCQISETTSGYCTRLVASLQGEQEREEVTCNHPQFTILGCPYTERECEECKHNIQLQKKKQPTKEEIKRQAHLFMAKDNEFLNIQNNFTVEELEATAEHLTDFGIFLIGAMEKYLQSPKPIEGEQEREEKSDADLLQDIYERNDMQVIHNSDIYLQGFQAGLDYNKDKSHGNPDVCPDCGSGIYNCKCQ